MQVIMGGSGSTGSSLLKNILNRNDDIFAGGETAFFAKKMIYENWDKAKSRVLKRKLFGLRNHGWHIYNGTDLLQKEYLWQQNDLQVALFRSRDLLDFTNTFYAKSLNLSGAHIWLEKTPANSACFASFLRSFENGKVIHMVRNPFDTIASLQKRGYDLYYAVGIYLLNSVCGASVMTSSRCLTVKYEDLISDPEITVRSICSFLDVPYQSRMLIPQGEKVSEPKLYGWKYDETKAIGKGSVGRFNTLSDEMQHEILEAVNMVQVNEVGKSYYDVSIQNIQELCGILNYDFYSIGKRTTYKKLKKQELKDRIQRVRRGYPTGFYYPLRIQK
ncbi:MAG: sulfotransferase [Saprospiraceae bacterium]|nr:sulfotransferase [Saprospiraceae bacterium]